MCSDSKSREDFFKALSRVVAESLRAECDDGLWKDFGIPLAQMDAFDFLRSKREDILKMAARHGARNLRVFGSVVRREAGPASDVDFLVDLGPNRTPFFPGGLVTDLEELLGRPVDVVTEKALHWYIRDRVLKEAVPL